eukprot:1144816-Pelagomonas_calceolata.AAC.5
MEFLSFSLAYKNLNSTASQRTGYFLWNSCKCQGCLLAKLPLLASTALQPYLSVPFLLACWLLLSID